MTPASLSRQGLRYYWRTNLTVVAGVAVATAVLAGALVVGESVRRSLATLALSRLGATDVVVTAPLPVREALAADLASGAGPRLSAAPLLTLDGAVAHDTSRRRASRVAVYGVDDRFWTFHGVSVEGPAGRNAFLSPALADELGAAAGDTILVTVEAPSDIPPGVLQGRRTDRARILRLRTAQVLEPARMGEFTLRPTQAGVLAVFVPLTLLQREIDAVDRANTFLVARAAGQASPEDGGGLPVSVVRTAIRQGAQLVDQGVRVRALEGTPWVAVEARGGFVSDDLVKDVEATAQALGTPTLPVLAYLANAIRIGDREIPYSVVAGLDLAVYDPAAVAATVSSAEAGAPSPIWLNEWAAVDLGAKPGDRVTLDYYLWSDEKGLASAQATFAYAGTVPMSGAGGDQALIPEYPGLTSEVRMSDWDPPFPVDLKRVRDRDEEYWNRHRTAPKAFVTLADAQRLWGSRYGHVTSVRLGRPGATAPSAERVEATLRGRLDPVGARAMAVLPVRADAAQASQGTTDFGEYFLYFTFFLVVAALLLTALLFRLSIEQRLREIGLLRAVGFAPSVVRALLLREGLLLAAAGSVIGMVGALGWAALVLTGLRTWWFDAVGTDRLTVHPSWPLLLVGGLAGLLAGAAAMWRTLGSLTTLEPRVLLHAVEAPAADEGASGGSGARSSRARVVGLASGVVALIVLAAAAAGVVPRVAGFFGSGGLALVAGISGMAAWFRRTPSAPVAGAGWWPVARLGFRGPRQRPGRAATAVALIAFATFVIVAVGAFRRDAASGEQRAPGTGGYALIGESVLPLLHDPGSPAGREALSLPTTDELLARASFTRLRLRAGDEASCLTLYRPTRPRMAGVPAPLVEANRFPFASSLAETDSERAKPLSLLNRRFEDGAVPAIGDANSLTYVFHVGLGDTITIETGSGPPVTLRIVGMLADSVFQSELLIADEQFVRLFPREEGYRLLLVDAPTADEGGLLTRLEDRLSDYGLDLQRTDERLAAYHRVENTYISTFQALGLLGLLLGTCGVGIMVLRGVVERRRELAVLRAVGYRRIHLSLMVVAESALVAACGALVGTACALLATAPALSAQGGASARPEWLLLPLLVIGVALLSASAAVVVVGRMPVAATIRSE